MMPFDSKSAVDFNASHCVASACMPDQKIFFRIDSELKHKFQQMCLDRRMKQQAALTSMIEWMIKQSDLVQVAVLHGLGINPPDAEAAAPDGAIESDLPRDGAPSPKAPAVQRAKPRRPVK